MGYPDVVSVCVGSVGDSDAGSVAEDYVEIGLYYPAAAD